MFCRSDFCAENPAILKAYLGDVVKYSRADFGVLDFMIETKDSITAESRKAVEKAVKWKLEKNTQNLRSKDVGRKLEVCVHVAHGECFYAYCLVRVRDYFLYNCVCVYGWVYTYVCVCVCVCVCACV